MKSTLAKLRSQLRDFPQALSQFQALRETPLTQLRIRFIMFHDSSDEAESLSETDFMRVIPENNQDEFDALLANLNTKHLHYRGSGTSALLALESAIDSDWVRPQPTSPFCRHVIVLLTGSRDIHDLGGGAGTTDEYLAKHSWPWETLFEMWHSRQGRLSQESKRLILFAPDGPLWGLIGDSWGSTIWLPIQREEMADYLDSTALVNLIGNEI
jgi:hypothetical protein